MTENKTILLCAGGTGGHLFPAQALGRELMARGWEVHLATDARGQKFAGEFSASDIHIVKSATISWSNPLKLIKAAYTLGAGYRQSRELVARLEPVVAIGFGGYPTLPPIIAASAADAKIVLHEQNAVMGRANKVLAKKALAIVMGFYAGADGDATDTAETIVLGNPVRSEVLAAAKSKYRSRKKSDVFNLLVFGGSQGAQYFGEVVPEAIGQMGKTRINIVQQCRADDEDELKEAYRRMGIKAEVAQFFSPMAERIKKADFVISRAGASTVSELAIIGRPSILVPYPHALDHDQAMNAAEMEKAGGCKVIKQADLSAQRLVDELKNAINQPKALAQMAQNAKKTGKPEATKDLVQLIEHIAAGGGVEDYQRNSP